MATWRTKNSSFISQFFLSLKAHYLKYILLFLYLFYVYSCSACIYVCVPYAYLVPKEARGAFQNPTYKMLCAIMWVPGIEPQFSGRVASALNILKYF